MSAAAAFAPKPPKPIVLWKKIPDTLTFPAGVTYLDRDVFRVINLAIQNGRDGKVSAAELGRILRPANPHSERVMRECTSRLEAAKLIEKIPDSGKTNRYAIPWQYAGRKPPASTPECKPKGTPEWSRGGVYKNARARSEEIQNKELTTTQPVAAPPPPEPPQAQPAPVPLANPELTDHVVTALRERRLSPVRGIIAGKLAGKTLEDVHAAFREFDRARNVGVGWFLHLLAATKSPPKPPLRLNYGESESFAEYCQRTGESVADETAWDRWLHAWVCEDPVDPAPLAQP